MFFSSSQISVYRRGKYLRLGEALQGKSHLRAEEPVLSAHKAPGTVCVPPAVEENHSDSQGIEQNVRNGTAAVMRNKTETRAILFPFTKFKSKHWKDQLYPHTLTVP